MFFLPGYTGAYSFGWPLANANKKNKEINGEIVWRMQSIWLGTIYDNNL